MPVLLEKREVGGATSEWRWPRRGETKCLDELERIYRRARTAAAAKCDCRKCIGEEPMRSWKTLEK